MFDINVKITLQEQFLLDIMTNAVEGGQTGMWADWIEIQRDDDLNVLVIKFKPEDYDDVPDTEFTVRYSELPAAIELILKGEVKDYGTRDDIYQGVLEQDAGEIDAIAADVIIQVAAFKEVLYG